MEYAFVVRSLSIVPKKKGAAAPNKPTSSGQTKQGKNQLGKRTGTQQQEQTHTTNHHSNAKPRTDGGTRGQQHDQTQQQKHEKKTRRQPPSQTMNVLKNAGTRTKPQPDDPTQQPHQGTANQTDQKQKDKQPREKPPTKQQPGKPRLLTKCGGCQGWRWGLGCPQI